MSVEMPKLVYPGEWGSSFWKTLHSVAAMYPENPGKVDKVQYRLWFHYTINHLPCDDCKNHARQYIDANPLNVKSRKDVVEYVCQFHNSVNARLGKPRIDCNALQSEPPSCEKCSAKAKQAPRYNRVVVNYKKAMADIIELICKREGVNTPEIVFAPCPGDPTTSCTRIPHDKQGATLSPVKIWLNPNQASVRTAIHETLHYFEAIGHKPTMSHDELDSMARDMVDKEFISDNGVKNYRELYDKPSWMNSFPTFAKVYNKNKGVFAVPEPSQEAQEPKTQFQIVKADDVVKEKSKVDRDEGGAVADGILNTFDSIFTPFGEAVGLRARDIGEANIPNLMANIYTTVADSNLTPFGALVVHILGSIVTLSAGVLGKNHMGYGDRKLLANFGANLFWSGLPYVGNPKINKQIINDAKLFGKSIANYDLHFVGEAVVENKKTLQNKARRDQQRAGSPPVIKAQNLRPLTKPARLPTVQRDQEYDSDDLSISPDELPLEPEPMPNRAYRGRFDSMPVSVA